MTHRSRSAPAALSTTVTTKTNPRFSPIVTLRAALFGPSETNGLNNNNNHDTAHQSSQLPIATNVHPTGVTPTATSTACTPGSPTHYKFSLSSGELNDAPDPKPEPKHYDPVTLPEDVFHLIFSRLDLPTLASAQQVSHAWRSVIRTNGSLWRRVCIANGVRQVDIDELDKLAAKRRARREGAWLVTVSGRRDAQSVWRHLCSDRYPGIKAWKTGTPLVWDSSGTPPLRCALSVPDLDGIICVEADKGTACVANGAARVYEHNLTKRPSHLASTFTRLGDTVSTVATAGKWVAVARWSAGHEGPWPLDKPTYLVVYSMLPLPKRAPYVPGSALDVQGPRGLLQYVSHVQIPMMWGYNVQMVIGKRGATLALLCCPARMSQPGHWVSTSSGFQVHIWYLDEGNFKGASAHRIVNLPDSVKARSMCLADDHLLIPNGEKIVVMDINTGRCKYIPTTPHGAALATSVSFLNPKSYPPALRTLYKLPFYSEGTGWNDAHKLSYLGVERREWDPVSGSYGRGGRSPEIATTTNDIIYTTGGGSLVVIKDYRNVLPRLIKTKDAASVASDGSLLIACWPHASVVRTCGDRIAVQTVCPPYTNLARQFFGNRERNSNNIVLLDASSLPTPKAEGRRYPPEKREYYLEMNLHDGPSYQSLYKMPSTASHRAGRKNSDSPEGPTLQFRRTQHKHASELLPGALTPSALFIPLRMPSTTRIYVPARAPTDQADRYPSMRVLQWGRPALSLAAMGMGSA